jgi:fatty acid-binding protein DegV/CheY-like chemotaxis protein
MTRQAVLVVEPDPAVRKELGVGLARYGYEVVPAVTSEEGERFAAGLGPGVVVASAELPGYGDGAILERWRGEAGGEQTLVLLGKSDRDESTLPRAVRFVPVDGLSRDQVVHRIRLVLLGREVGVETDPALESLVGEVEQSPVLELVRGLARGRFVGRLELPAGEIRFAATGVCAAAAGPFGGSGRGRVGGLKAFCRLGRMRQGTLHVRPEDSSPVPPPGEAVAGRVDDLVIRAVEDASAGDFPHPRARVAVALGPSFFSTRFTDLEQRVLERAQGGTTAAALFDALAETDGEVLAVVESLAGRGLLTLAEPEARCYVVTDSSADLPIEVARAHGIHVVPLSVTFGKQRFYDGVDLRPKRFYEMLTAGGDHPFTKPPEVADFERSYGELLPRRDVVSVHLSGKLSQTVVHARQAREGVVAGGAAGGAAKGAAAPGVAIDEAAAMAAADTASGGARHELRIVDSGLVSLALGTLAVFAARLAARGRSAAEVEARLDDLKGRMDVLFVVDTLEYLRRGGRIGAARAWIGKLLDIKPILGVADGEVVPVDRARGGRAAHPRILELMAGRADGERPMVAGFAHANAPVWADRLRTLVEARFRVVETLVAEMGPTVGTHAGPGTVGVAWLQLNDDELDLLAPLDA